MDLTPEELKQKQAGEQLKRELARHAQDTVMVHNPTDSDYVVVWDKYRHPVPNCHKDVGFGKGNLELPFYIASKYFSEMKDLLLNERNQKEVEKRLNERNKKGLPAFETKWHENQSVWANLPRTNDKTAVEALFNDIWLGTVREFGAELPEVETQQNQIDLRNDEERLKELMAKKYVPSNSPMTPEQTISNKSSKVKEITND